VVVAPTCKEVDSITVNETPTHEWRALGRLKRRWNASSLAFQFLTLGGLVSLLAMILVGAVVTSLIEKAVTRNVAATTALYVDSVIAPLLPDMRTSSLLDDVVRRALDETLGQGALGRRIFAMRLWARDGTILYADDDRLIGRQFETTPDLRQAFAGDMVANYDHFNILDEGSEAPSKPLLEIHNPILQPWSGDVVAVIQLYEFAYEFEAALQSARLRSWVAVAVVTAMFFLALGMVVLRGSRTIDRQALDLKARVSELTALLEENRALHLRVQRATQRATSLNESYLRRLGADLHDGPAQLVALASLRLDSQTVLAADAAPEIREREVQEIRQSLEEALQEIRTICQGLVLPQIETASLAEVVNYAVDAYERKTGAAVERQLQELTVTIPLSQRICVFRFLQEALNNGYRHCRSARQMVSTGLEQGKLSVAVSDNGPGFDPANIRPDSIGIAGIRERIESLGGRFRLDTSERGTTLVMALDVEESDGI
jgi:signal transduction histidine kinase